MPQEVTQNDHLNVTYIIGDALGSKKNIATISIGTPTAPLNSPLNEAIKAAQDLAAYYAGNKIYLCLSGGVDSECMLESFVRARVDFCPVLLVFSGGYNEFDIHHARQACRRHGLSWIEKNLDLDRFYNSKEFLEICDATECRSPMLAVHMWLFLELDGVPVCAWNPPRIVVGGNDKIRLTLPQELYFSYHRYSHKMNRPLRPFFFLESPALYYSFFHLSFVQSLLRDPKKWRSQYNLDEYYIKCHMYRNAGYHFSDKTYKFTGFEHYKNHVMSTYKSDQHEYTRRFRTPLEEKFATPDITYAKIDLNWVLGKNDSSGHQDNFHNLVTWDSTLAFQMEKN
ncbi:MAG: hypothetical protein HUU57_16855 [Bdellovibrio sp.]|nr:hypothetical protein [Bdellovibrio sp.]